MRATSVSTPAGSEEKMISGLEIQFCDAFYCLAVFASSGYRVNVTCLDIFYMMYLFQWWVFSTSSAGEVLDSPLHMKWIPSDEGVSVSVPGKVV